MSLLATQNELLRFIERRSAGVLCIKGAWGVGKSHFWRTFVKQYRNSIHKRGYSYVSLFGINSLDQLKAAIRENGQAIEDVGGARRIIDKITAVARSGRKIKHVDAALEIADQLAFYLLRDELICFDDIERRGKDLRIDDVLGLATQLREERDCKVVLILNESALDKREGEQSDYRKYYEKAIDAHVEFAPNSEECCRIAYGENEKYARAFEHSKALGLTNIRVMRRIITVVDQIAPIIEGRHKAVGDAVTKSVVVLSWSAYGEGGPPHNWLLNGDRIFGYKKKEPTDEELGWQSALELAGYGVPSDIDYALMRGIQNGYFVSDALQPDLRRMQAAAENAGALRKYDEAWRTLWDEFGGDADELAQKFVDGFKEGAAFISFGNFNGIVSTLRFLDRGDLATEVIKFYVETQKPDKGFKNWRRHLYEGREIDHEVATTLDQEAKRDTDKRDPREVLVGIVTDASWSPEDLELLNRMSVDELYNFYRNHKGRDLGKIIRESKNLGDSFQTNSRAALERIASENKLDRVRVVNFHRVLPKPIQDKQAESSEDPPA